MPKHQFDFEPSDSDADFGGLKISTISPEDLLRTLVDFRSNPWFAELLRRMRDAETTLVTSAVDVIFQGVHDIFNQQQILGEIRGVYRFSDETDTLLENLTNQVKRKQDGTASTNNNDNSANAPTGISSTTGATAVSSEPTDPATRVDSELGPDPIGSPLSI